MSDLFDRIEQRGHSLIQHGASNQRIYLMKVDVRDLPGLPKQIEELARQNSYTKIFAKVPQDLVAEFESMGYRSEAVVPGFYGGLKDAAFMGFYLAEERRTEQAPELVADVLEVSRSKATAGPGDALPASLRMRELGMDDAVAMSEVYREVFATYPFPIHDPSYLCETMRTHIRYFGVFEGSTLIAVSSAEMDRKERNAEMTDFATRPAARGAGLALHLLNRMEDAMHEEDILTPYTIARAYSHGMNVTFARAGYLFGGTLTNNTQISGRIESMNVWYKSLQESAATLTSV